MTVSSSTNRVSYAGNGSTTVFPYTYKIFDEDDLTVILRAANGTETVQTITSQYTVSGVGDAGGGNVTMLTAPAAGTTLVILREQDLVQGLDIVPNDPFPADSLEGALDKLTFMVQQHEETLGRTIKASRTNTIAGSEFTISAADRANKVFAFDGSGDVSITQGIGIYRGNWSASTAYSVRDIVKDTSTNNIFIANTAHTSSGAQPITTNTDSAKWDLLVDAASATTSAINAAASASAAEADRILAQSAKTDAETAQAAAELAETNAETAETNAEAAQTAAEAAQAAAEAALDNFEDIYLGAKSSDPTVDNDGDPLTAGDLYFNTVSNNLKVYTGSAWADAALTAANFLTVANNLSDVASAATARTNLGLEIGVDVQAYDATILVDADIGVNVQAYDADTAKLDVAQSFTAAQRGSTDTDATNTGNVTLDFAVNQNFVLTLTGNVTLDNPTTEVVGQSGFIVFIQDGTGGRTVSLGTDYETAGGTGLTLSSAASATDVVPYIVAASGRILLGAPQLAFA
jgi:hypothetical protein